MKIPVDPSKKERRTIVGVIVAAIAASVCCVGPLLLLGLGIGGAWVGSLTALEPFRPYLMALTLGVLAYAFYKIYKPKAEVCVPGSYCANPKSDKINKITLWISTIFVIGLLATPDIASYMASNQVQAADQTTLASNIKQITLDVPGMTCPACPFTVQKSLRKLDGVVYAKADLNTKKAVVKYDPQKVSLQAMIEATTNAGYPSTPENKE